MEYTIFYDSAQVKSILTKAIYRIKYPDINLVDINGNNEAANDAAIAAITDATQTKIILAVPITNSHTVNNLTGAQYKALLAKLTTAARASSSDVTGTCQANSTSTEVVLAATDSDVDDFYNNMIIEFAGTSTLIRQISDYDGASVTATIDDTLVAVTTTSTYTIYYAAGIELVVDDADGADLAIRAWDVAYPYQSQRPFVCAWLENASKLMEKHGKTATGVGTAELTDTGEFTAGKYDDGDYYLCITNGSTAGEYRKILSNTADVLTLESDFDVPLTGTPTYQIQEGKSFLFWNIYLPYAINGWLDNDTLAEKQAWISILDQYEDLVGDDTVNRKYWQNIATLEEYLEKGKHIVEGIAAGIVS